MTPNPSNTVGDEELIAFVREDAAAIRRRGFVGAHDAFAARLERLCDLASTSEGEGWRPIESAPKDGTPILVIRHSDMFGWVLGWAEWADIKGIAGWISHGFFEIPGVLGLAHPTLWRPLPTPPADLGGEDEEQKKISS